jgi:dCTP deaminase
MILSGVEIIKACAVGDIVISPLDLSSLNPNSYNYHLGPRLLEIGDGFEASDEIQIPSDGYLLEPGNLYLGHTYETIGSAVHTVSLIGRSSTGRLGLFVQIDADHGQLGAVHRWTLELRPTIPVVVYPYMKIGQVSFWLTRGADQSQYRGWYALQNGPTESVLQKSVTP